MSQFLSFLLSPTKQTMWFQNRVLCFSLLLVSISIASNAEPDLAPGLAPYLAPGLAPELAPASAPAPEPKPEPVPKKVTYDGTSIMVDGKRELLFSGSIHYPRSTPNMWVDLIRRSKEGGLNTIQTYVFWNVHEPVEGTLDFEGNNDIVKFIRLIGENDMYVTLRLGPFIQAEWNHGGLPYWLREVQNISFRNDNEPFKHYMENYAKMIVKKMKEEKLFASQGGPIVLAQIENEYNHVQRAYREGGDRYVQWAANMAVGMDVGVPWIMCKQTDAPDPVINACNGRHCGDTFTGPNKPYKPALWTENWTAQFRVWGDPVSKRSAEDLAFSVARWFSKNGSLVNYYMYHGGTNFGRTTSAFTTTRYYDEAPLDEFGLKRDPKWGHLRDVHMAIKLCQKALLEGNHTIVSIKDDLELRYFEIPGTDICSAFMTNNNTKEGQIIEFRGEKYYIPTRSISILPDCKNVVFNTQHIVSQHNERNFVRSEKANNLTWEMSKEAIPDDDKSTLNNPVPLELYTLTKDTTDYAWYTTILDLNHEDLPIRDNVLPILRVASMGHAMLAFVNGEYIGSAHGSHLEKSFVLQVPIKNLKTGKNQISFLASLVGLIDSGANLERRYAGPRLVTVLGLNTGTLDLTFNDWGHQVGLDGEKDGAYSPYGFNKTQWTPVNGPGGPVTWYRTYFDEPEGQDPIAIRMSNMSKGMIWVNGKGVGRYWENFLSPEGYPTQTEYHIPRFFLNSTQNLLVIFDEEGGNPNKIEILTVNRDTICSFIDEVRPPRLNSSDSQGGNIRPVIDDPRPAANLTCPDSKNITTIEFAGFGDPTGSCGRFVQGKCNSAMSKEIVEKECLGKTSCSVPIDRIVFDKDEDGCPDTVKTLAIQAKCSA